MPRLIRLDDRLPAYERLLDRAHEQRIRVRRDAFRSTPDHAVWYATSGRDHWDEYELHLVCDADGVFLSCTCDAGRFETPCKHGSKVAEAAGFIGGEKPEPLFKADGTVNGKAALRLLNDDEG